ncbi:ribonuclease D [Actinopolyspora erythraea]|uniref:3'-5' exonuclease n=1 Tax=Actinopolyspora erythraea TaxID=414996 RepID=A0A099D4K8_9ACTN|nr:ribonuclease D [Actinopolyspora erythraea]ASU79495.1 ribonuclease D [Actinopolyspora erythraea]KGI80876.1 3'-5' exonuclease [Actinopolyspora erythraea]
MDAVHPESAEPDRSEPVLLTRPAGGVPPVVEQPRSLRLAAAALTAGSGPIAIDTERASGYRYSQRAYLLQLRREGSGTVLIDPIALNGDLGPLVSALGDTEWVLHAASQDLPCLAELDLRPDRLFDTELAARLAGYERVSLGALAERLLSYRLEKGHGAADWSRRPLPREWLVYAALDVELLVELRAALHAELDRQGKLEWAAQEFEAVRTAPPAPSRPEPWRRTSGIHRLRTPVQLAIVRALWELRDDIARRRDIAPGRILPDSAIIRAAQENPATREDLVALPVFGGKQQRRRSGQWFEALRGARELDKEALPSTAAPNDGPPPTNRWADRDAAAAARLNAVRNVLNRIAEENRLPVENLLLPDLVRRLCWQPPSEIAVEPIAEHLRERGARRWQVELTAEPIAKAIRESEDAHADQGG